MNDEIGTQALEFLLDTIYRINSTKDLPSFEREASFRLYALIPCVQVMFFPLSENSEGGGTFAAKSRSSGAKKPCTSTNSLAAGTNKTDSFSSWP